MVLSRRLEQSHIAQIAPYIQQLLSLTLHHMLFALLCIIFSDAVSLTRCQSISKELLVKNPTADALFHISTLEHLDADM